MNKINLPYKLTESEAILLIADNCNSIKSKQSPLTKQRVRRQNKNWQIKLSIANKSNSKSKKINHEKALIFVSEEGQFSNIPIRKSIRYCRSQNIKFRVYKDTSNVINKIIKIETPTIKEIIKKLKENSGISKLILSGANNCLKKAYLASVAHNLNIEVIDLDIEKSNKI